jgi:hypothetical protein
MREVPKQLTEDELLRNMQNCLEDLDVRSKEYEVITALKQNIELRRENMRILIEL